MNGEQGYENAVHQEKMYSLQQACQICALKKSVKQAG